MGKVYDVDFNNGKYKQIRTTDTTKNRANEFRRRLQEETKKPKNLNSPNRKPRRIKVKNPEVAKRRKKELKEANVQRNKMANRAVNYRIPKEYHPQGTLKKRKQPKKKIAPRVAAIATSLAVAAAGLAIYKNISDKKYPIDITEAMLTKNDKNTIGVTDELLNEASELSYLINDIENLPNSVLISMSKEISDFQIDTLEEKISSALGVDKENLSFERGYTEKEGDRIPSRVKIREYSSITHSSNSSHILPSDTDEYIMEMYKFKEMAENIETSDINRNNLMNRLKKEFEMGKGMLNRIFTVDKNGKLKMESITNETLWNYTIPDEER